MERVDVSKLPPVRLENISDEARKALASVKDYQLDYNIHMFRGVKTVRPKVAAGNSLNGSELPTYSAMMHDRLYELLVQERERRKSTFPLLEQLEEKRVLHSESFIKFAVLQGMEYDFEEFLDDSELALGFAEAPEMAMEINDKEDTDKAADSNILRVMIPLAAQYIVSGVDAKEKIENLDEETVRKVEATEPLISSAVKD